MAETHLQASQLPAAATSGSSLAIVLPLAATWLLVFAAVLSLLWPLALLFDGDSYYHLAIARAYLQRGLFSDLPWARFSVMHVGFGDKDFLFHMLLLPGAAARDPVFGAKLTLAALDATILTSFAHLAMRAAGERALVLPALALVGSFWFDIRLIRLRPELLALLLLLWTLHALSERRALLAGACACAFALGYTAFHALLGLACLCFALRLALDRKPSWRLLLWPALGVLTGLLLHPHFPQNLRIFWLQNFEFWRYQDTQDIGDEIRALGWFRWLRYDWPMLVGCATLFAGLRRSQPLDPATRDAGLVYCVGALPFVLLFMHSGRFALYAVPLGLLAALWVVRLLGFELGARLWLHRWAGPRVWLVLSLLGCLTLPLTAAALQAQIERDGCAWPALRRDLEALGRVLPGGAKVAAPWDSAEDYMYFAPQGRYLNVLDPLFMRSAHPQAYNTLRALFAAEVLDVPLTLQAELDSDFLAFSVRKYPALREQLAADPRVELIQPQGQVAYRVWPERARSFVRDLRVAGSRAELTQPTAARYPRHAEPAGRRVEGIIDGARLGRVTSQAVPCVWFAPEPSSAHNDDAEYELGSTAPARLWLGEQLLTNIEPRPRLLLGSGTRVRLSGLAGLALEVCPAADIAPRFYLLRRQEH